MLQTFAIYLLKNIICSALLLSYYWIALRNKQFHYYNRFYLLSVVILSIALPLLNLQLFTFKSNNDAAIKLFRFIYPIENHVVRAKSFSVDWQQLLIIFSVAVTLCLLLMLAIRIIRLYKFKRIYPVNKTKEFDFINTDLQQAPFSFLKNIFWRSDISLGETTGQQILQHEITHIKQKHTWDKLFVQIVLSVFWMNPFYRLIQRELYFIHEFIADEKAIADKDASAFASMLLHAQYGKIIFSPAQSFFYSPIKRRLFMLTTLKKSRFNYARRITALPLLAFIVLFFSFKLQEKNEEVTYKANSNTYSIRPADVLQDTTQPKELGYYKGKAVYKVAAYYKKEIAILTFADKTEQQISIQEARRSGFILPQPPSPVPDGAVEITATVNDGKKIIDVQLNAKDAGQKQTPSFPGGPSAWQKFLEKTLNSNIPVDKGAPPGNYTVIVSFVVDAEGNVSNVKALNDPGYGTSAEAARVIAVSGKWLPAIQNGKKVRVETKQAITFQVSEQ